MKKMENGACGRRQPTKEKGIEECVSCGMPSGIKQSDVDYLFWNVPLPLYITNEEGNFVGFNEEFLELFGYTREDMGKVKALDLYVDIRDREPLLENLVKKGEIKDYEVRLKRKNGEERLCKIGAVARKTEDGRVLYYGFIRDITERRQLHEAAEKNAALEASVRTAVGMAHDFNNILTTIIGNVEHAKHLCGDIKDLLSKGLAESKQREELESILGGKPQELAAKLKVIESAAERAQELVQRLNGYTVTDKPENIDVNKIATDVINTMGSLAAKSGYHLNYELKTDRLIFAHSIQIYRIISNLVQNAGEAIMNAYDVNASRANASGLASDSTNPTGQTNLSNQTNLTTPTNLNNQTNGTITIVTQNVDIPTIFGSHGEIPEGSYVLLSVSDNGPGIQSEAMEKIFEPYFTTKSSGTGLGLFNVWKIVSDYNGYINVLTRTEPKGERGTGTTFQIYLPKAEIQEAEVPKAEILTTQTGAGEQGSLERIAATSQTPSAQSSSAQASSAQSSLTYSNLNILVVDNEDTITFLLDEYLTRMGHHVMTANSAEEALVKYKQQKYDIIISDVNMPRMTGLDLCKRVVEINPNARFCLISGYFEAANVPAFTKLGVKGFLTKPIREEQIKALINSVMSSADYVI